MDAQVLLAVQQAQHRVRDAANAKLERGVIRDQLGYVARDSRLELRWLPLPQLRQAVVQLDNVVNVAYVQETIPQHPRHCLVHLHDDLARVPRRGFGGDHLHAQAQVPVLVRRRNLQYRHIQRHATAIEQVANPV
jgi:hypothetical protein